MFKAFISCWLKEYVEKATALKKGGSHFFINNIFCDDVFCDGVFSLFYASDGVYGNVYDSVCDSVYRIYDVSFFFFSHSSPNNLHRNNILHNDPFYDGNGVFHHTSLCNDEGNTSLYSMTFGFTSFQRGNPKSINLSGIYYSSINRSVPIFDRNGH